MNKNYSKYEGLFVFSDEKTLSDVVPPVSELPAELSAFSEQAAKSSNKESRNAVMTVVFFIFFSFFVGQKPDFISKFRYEYYITKKICSLALFRKKSAFL